VAEILDDFRTLQYYIAAAPTEPPNTDDHYTEGWAALRQCAIDGQHILECAADTSVPTPDGGEEEQRKAELKQYVLLLLTTPFFPSSCLFFSSSHLFSFSSSRLPLCNFLEDIKPQLTPNLNHEIECISTLMRGAMKARRSTSDRALLKDG
jgi:hypothetical protein